MLAIISSLSDIDKVATRQHAPIMVVKPLVESQRSIEILDYFPKSFGIWMVRHYKDVANSSFRKFGVEATRRNLESVLNNDYTHWMAEGASDRVRETVNRFYSDDMPPLDGKALIWYVRNSLYFEHDLENHPRVRLLHYNDIVSRPSEVMQSIYAFIDVNYPSEERVFSL